MKTKLFVLIAIALNGTLALASTEVVCSTGGLAGARAHLPVVPASPDPINHRIKELQAAGKTVEVQQLITSIGGAASSNPTVFLVLDHICAVLKY